MDVSSPIRSANIPLTFASIGSTLGLGRIVPVECHKGVKE